MKETPNRHTPIVLLVDDEPQVLAALRRTLHGVDFDVITSSGGDDAMQVIASTPLAAVVSDQCMPKMNGATLLANVRRMQPDAARIMLTGSAELDVALAAVNEGGVNHILLKPWMDDRVRTLVQASVSRYRARLASQARDEIVYSQRDRLTTINADLSRRVELSASALTSAHDDTLNALVVALESREPDSAGHSHRVALYCLHFLRTIGFERSAWERAFRGALLHDIGKIGVPDAILLKPGSLTDEERRQIEQHVEIGYRVLRRIEWLSNTMSIPLFHHERVDGRGYPRGLSGNAIPLESRAFSIVDCYDALRSERRYKAAMGHEAACEIIAADAGSRFDSDLVAAFLSIGEPIWSYLGVNAAGVCVLADALRISDQAECIISEPARIGPAD